MPVLTAEERLGTVLGGRYRLESILGTGGTSVVYAATHAFTGRAVALKLLLPERSRDRQLVARFLREAQIASSFVHPNVVAILDMGTADGDTYLAMELVQGESLGALLEREGTLSPERTLELLGPVMEALEHAHARGIVHRDLKPENILVGHRGDGVERAVLLDFGMAKTNEAAWGSMTQSGVLVGTPLYMSPEQAEGAPDVGAASDVWSMGVTIYRCLSGELPFTGSSPTALLLAIARGTHVPLAVRAPGLPARLASWVEGALVVDVARRYADLRAMREALSLGPPANMERAETTETRVKQIDSADATRLLESSSPRRGWRWAAVLAGALATSLVLAGALLAWPVESTGSTDEPVTRAPSPAPRVDADRGPAPVRQVLAAQPTAQTAADAGPALGDVVATPQPPRRRRVALPRTVTPAAPEGSAPRTGTGLAGTW